MSMTPCLFFLKMKSNIYYSSKHKFRYAVIAGHIQRKQCPKREHLWQYFDIKIYGPVCFTLPLIGSDMHFSTQAEHFKKFSHLPITYYSCTNGDTIQIPEGRLSSDRNYLVLQMYVCVYIVLYMHSCVMPRNRAFLGYPSPQLTESSRHSQTEVSGFGMLFLKTVTFTVNE